MDENDIRSAGSTDTGAELSRKLDDANRRIAELESRTLTVTLPEPFDFYSGPVSCYQALHHSSCGCSP